MYGTVSIAAIIGMVVSMAVAILVPVILLVVWKKTQNPKISSFFIGAGTFILFALILEQLMHFGVMKIFGQEILTENVLFIAIYGGIAAATFEEIGRFLAMKFCMKNSLDKKNSIMYGIGHGGIESIIIVGLAGISNIATAIAVNAGQLDRIFSAAPAQKDALLEQISPLWTTPAYMFYLSGVERVIAITIHICLSYLVYKAVKYGEKKYFVIAWAFHFAVDCGIVLLNNLIDNKVLVEVILAVAVIALLVWIINLYRAENENNV